MKDSGFFDGGIIKDSWFVYIYGRNFFGWWFDYGNSRR